MRAAIRTTLSFSLLLLACDGDSSLGGKPGGGGGSDSGSADDTGGGGPDTDIEPAAVIDGEKGDSAGGALTGQSDLDGDGTADLVVAGPLGNRACLWSGASLQSLGCLNGELDYDYAGYAISGVGDRDGDGYDDLLLGAIANREAGGNSGKVYLFAGPLPGGDISLAARLRAWTGEDAGDYLGAALSPAGDLTGDGLPDLLFGAPGNDNGGAGGGRAYVVAGLIVEGSGSITEAWAAVSGGSGGTGGPPPPPGSPEPPHGAYGTGDAVGQSMVGQSDWNGDGLTDLGLGASGNIELGANTGRVYIFDGPIPGGALAVSAADHILNGPAMGSYAGSPLTETGDINANGYADLLVSADGQEAGRVYLLDGPLSNGPIDDAASIRFVGDNTGDLFGASLHPPADLDGDGELELIIGAPGSDRLHYEGGAAWLWDGPWAPGSYGVTTATAVLDAEAEADNFASAISLLGADRLAVGARFNNSGGLYAGRVYLYDLHSP